MPEQWNKYAATAARRHGRPGRELRPKSITIDIHSHVAVPAAAKFVEPYLDWGTIPLAHFATAETRALSQKQEADEEAALLRAADLIGQFGDPHYIRKANALYYEFEEAGVNRQLGYSSPADLVNLYPQFYWNSVAPHVQTAIR